MDYENMRVAKLKALARERGLRDYSQLRKAELIALLCSAADQGPQRLTRPSPLRSGVRSLWDLLRCKHNRLGPGSLVRKKWIYLNDKRCVKIDQS